MQLRVGANLCKFLQVDMLWICLAVRLKLYSQNPADQPIYCCSRSHRLPSPSARCRTQLPRSHKVYSLLLYVPEVGVAPEYVQNVLLIAINASSAFASAADDFFHFWPTRALAQGRSKLPFELSLNHPEAVVPDNLSAPRVGQHATSGMHRGKKTSDPEIKGQEAVAELQ